MNKFSVHCIQCVIWSATSQYEHKSGPPSNGVSLVGRWLPQCVCWLESCAWKFTLSNLITSDVYEQKEGTVISGSRKFCKRGPNLTTFFFYFILSWWGERGSKYHCQRAITGPPAKRHWNGVSMACRWWLNIECWLCSFVIFQGIWTNIVKKPYIFVIFRGCPDPPAPTPMTVPSIRAENALYRLVRFWLQFWYKHTRKCYTLVIALARHEH